MLFRSWDALLSYNEVDEIALEDKFNSSYQSRKFLEIFGADETQKGRAGKPFDMGIMVQLL